MSSDGEDMATVFEELSGLEKQFAEVELEALRSKEHSLKPLYAKRSDFLQQIPEFWPQVFLNAPEEIQQLYSSIDVAALAAIRNFTVERYQIESATKGEPRSLRFTFEFAENDHFEDRVLVKDFEFRPNEHGGNFVSKTVPIKWKGKKQDLTAGMLDAAVELEQAEEAMKLKKNGEEIDLVEREGLWQYEKLREKIVKAAEAADDEPTFLNWFGFRGAVSKGKEKAAKPAEKVENGENGADAEDEDYDDDDEGLLDVEIFPAGGDVANALAEDLWPDVMDYFIQAQEDPSGDFDGFDEDEDEDDEDVPELVPEEDARPNKRQRTD